MPKHTTTLPLSLPAPRSGTRLYHWFYEELRSAILEGRLKPGARLPATRDLARQYGLSRHLLAGGEALGYRPLREAVADYLNAARGVKCSADQVLIISGVQEALERAAHLLLNPGDPVWMEEPGYPGAAIVFRAVGAIMRRVPVDSEGLDLRHGQRRWGRAKLIYVTPAHQFPLGVTMSLRRRLALLEWARRTRTLIFEDDYDSEDRYSGRPIPALQGLDRS